MASSTSPALWWVRRDLRLADNPALQAAIHEGEAVLPLFVLDPVLLGSAGKARRGWLFAALHALDTDLQEAGGPGLSVVQGRPAAAVTRAARACGARTVHVSADFAPYGRRRDERVAAALAEHGIELRATGSPYAVAPGTLTNGGTTGCTSRRPVLPPTWSAG
jgi:deoxyribodipyrimidine photo-lyase